MIDIEEPRMLGWEEQNIIKKHNELMLYIIEFCHELNNECLHYIRSDRMLHYPTEPGVSFPE